MSVTHPNWRRTLNGSGAEIFVLLGCTRRARKVTPLSLSPGVSWPAPGMRLAHRPGVGYTRGEHCRVVLASPKD
eukprot:593036-Pyramimonas_sp.AAC.1